MGQTSSTFPAQTILPASSLLKADLPSLIILQNLPSTKLVKTVLTRSPRDSCSFVVQIYISRPAPEEEDVDITSITTSVTTSVSTSITQLDAGGDEAKAKAGKDPPKDPLAPVLALLDDLLSKTSGESIFYLYSILYMRKGIYQ